MLKKTMIITCLLLLGVISMTGAALAGGDDGAPRVTSLSGFEEVNAAGVPGQGDLDGSGFAAITLNYGQGMVCWEVSFEGIADPFAAHIHSAPAGVNGPIVVPLGPIAGGCQVVDQGLIKAIIQDPEQYYINVHNANFPGGALRGQLSNPGQSDK